GPTIKPAATIVQMLPTFSPREVMYFATTIAMTTFASSENCNWSGPMEIHREEPPTPVPIASVSTSSPRFTKEIGHANVLIHRESPDAPTANATIPSASHSSERVKTDPG